MPINNYFRLRDTTLKASTRQSSAITAGAMGAAFGDDLEEAAGSNIYRQIRSSGRGCVERGAIIEDTSCCK
jgi:hypothetical protein